MGSRGLYAIPFIGRKADMLNQQAVNDNVIHVKIWYNTRVRGKSNAIISRRKEIHIC